MNTGRTTSFFGCFLVGILMSKNNYDQIDVFLSSFLLFILWDDTRQLVRFLGLDKTGISGLFHENGYYFYVNFIHLIFW